MSLNNVIKLCMLASIASARQLENVPLSLEEDCYIIIDRISNLVNQLDETLAHALERIEALETLTTN